MALAIAGIWPAPDPSIAAAEEAPPTAATSRPDRVPLTPRPRPGSPSSDAGGGWWLGTAGIAAALAVFGGVSLASKRLLPTRDSGPIQVVGRSSLSSKHSACLLRVGDRVLIVGVGPQGAPSTLGEITDPLELARLAPRRASRPIIEPESESRPTRPTPRFDRRIGDDE